MVHVLHMYVVNMFHIKYPRKVIFIIFLYVDWTSLVADTLGLGAKWSI